MGKKRGKGAAKKKQRLESQKKKWLSPLMMKGLVGSIFIGLLAMAIAHLSSVGHRGEEPTFSDDLCKRGMQEWGLNRLDDALESYARGIAALRNSTTPHAAFCPS